MFYAKYFKHFLFPAYVVHVLPSWYYDPSNFRPNISVWVENQKARSSKKQIPTPALN